MDPGAPSPDDITRILHEWKRGDPRALDKLLPIIYEELRLIASRQPAYEWRHDRLRRGRVSSFRARLLSVARVRLRDGDKDAVS